MTGYHTYKTCIEACLRCAAICSHCASSCTQEEDIKMMAGCIQLDMECSALCYASAQLMSLGSGNRQRSAAYVQTFAKSVVLNAAGRIPGIARNMPMPVNSVQTNVVKRQLKFKA